jgi:hypothetical protein
MVTPLLFADPCIIKIQPEEVVGPPPNIGDEFEIKILIENAVNVFSWKVSVKWDPSLVSWTGEKIEGDFLKQGGASTIFVTGGYDEIMGRMGEVTQTRFGGSITGNGELCRLIFEVKGFGESEIELQDQYVVSPPTTVVDSVINNACDVRISAPPPSGPKAVIKPTEKTHYKEDKIVFSASDSLPGYDTLPTGGTCPITQYKWEIDAGSNESIDKTVYGQNIDYTPTMTGQLKITLTVDAPDTNPPSNTGYTSTHSTSITYTIIDKPTLPSIDVYTERGGRGLNAASDVFSPQDLVNVYAYVSNNGAALENQNVAFQVINEEKETFSLRSAETNSFGISAIQYRMPWATSTEESFGQWKIIVTTKINNVTVTDQLTYNFEYLLKDLSIQLLDFQDNPKQYYNKGEITRVRITFRNNRVISLPIFVAVNIYDCTQVPIDYEYVIFTLPPKGNTTVSLDTQIPTWSKTGPMKIYVNFYRAENGVGVPYCPERFVESEIK